MANTARLYRIEALIRARGHVSFATLLQELEVSPATLKRDLEYLRSRLGAPIEYDRELNGYRFASANATAVAARHELPGLWFDESELYALLMAWQLLGGLEGSELLSRHLQPLLQRIEQLLSRGAGDAAAAAQLTRRVRIVSAQRRAVPSRWFERVSAALLSRRQLRLLYRSRSHGPAGAGSERVVSPQRLVHYRHTWYLDAWCHRASALRRFALDAVQDASVLETPAIEWPAEELSAIMDGGYGIFAGQGGARRQWARLRFDPQAAAWASREEWHPQQRGRFLEDGGWLLELPYEDDTELVMDILRQGPQLQVLAPPALREKVRAALALALQQYA